MTYRTRAAAAAKLLSLAVPCADSLALAVDQPHRGRSGRSHGGCQLSHPAQMWRVLQHGMERWSPGLLEPGFDNLVAPCTGLETQNRARRCGACSSAAWSAGWRTCCSRCLTTWWPTAWCRALCSACASWSSPSTMRRPTSPTCAAAPAARRGPRVPTLLMRPFKVCLGALPWRKVAEVDRTPQKALVDIHLAIQTIAP